MVRYFRIMLRLSILLICMVFSAISNAQQYEGEKNKKGQPEGQGVIIFNNGDYVERFEGTFAKGMPVQGKSTRIDKYGRLQMEFEGTVHPQKKGVFTKLADLLCYGNIAYYCYENAEYYKMFGYYVNKGYFEGDRLKNGLKYGVKNMPKMKMTPEIKKYYDYLLPLYTYDLMKEQGDVFFSRLKKSQGFFELPSIIDQKIEKYTITHAIGNNADNQLNGLVYGLAYKDNDKERLCYFKGEFEDGHLSKIQTLKQYVNDGKVMNCYINSVAQKYTPFTSQEDFENYLVIGDDHFADKLRQVSSYLKVGSSSMGRLFNILDDSENRNNKDIIEKAKVICAYKLSNPQRNDIWEIYRVLKNFPEIANAKNVIATWDASKRINIKDAYLEFLRHQTKNLFHFFHYVYNDWGTLTEDQIHDAEYNFILTNSPRILNQEYKLFFPNGRYAGKDFYKEAWAQAYIDHYKSILKKNDPKLWIDRKDYSNYKEIRYNDWLHYPRLSQGIGGYKESTQLSSLMEEMKNAPRDLMFNKRKLSFLKSLFESTKFVFQTFEDSDYDNCNNYAFNELDKGPLLDEAKTYRSLLDAIAASAQIDDDLCRFTSVSKSIYSFHDWRACHQVEDYLIEGIKAARALSASTPEIRPACKKAEEFIMRKYKMLEDRVFIHDSGWNEVIKEANINRTQAQMADQKILQEVENLGLPNYEYNQKNWEKDYNGESYRKISFNDLTDIKSSKIWKASNGSYYKTVTGAFIKTKYKTENDAIIAAYAYLKYGVTRKKGQL